MRTTAEKTLPLPHYIPAHTPGCQLTKQPEACRHNTERRPNPRISKAKPAHSYASRRTPAQLGAADQHSCNSPTGSPPTRLRLQRLAPWACPLV